MIKEFPKYIYTCQKDDIEFHLLGAVEKHKEETQHSDFWLHVNGDKKVK